MTNDKNFLNLQALSNSLKVIENSNDYINSNTLSNIVLDIEKDISKINFEHGNCFNDYKDLIDNINTGLTDLKGEIAKLNDSLDKVVSSFDEFENINLRKNSLTADVTKIPPVGENNTQTESNDSINTVPIGLGIAAAGITGAVGAVALDSMHYRYKKDLDDYDDTEQYIEEKIEDKREKDIVFDDIRPYRAERDQNKVDKFYGE